MITGQFFAPFRKKASLFFLNLGLTSPDITLRFLISGVLWSGALRRLVQHLTRGAVDPFVWTDCKFGYFLIYFGFKYSFALLIIISVEKFIALYFPLRTKTICTVSVAKRVSLATAIIFLIFDSQFLIIGSLHQ